MSFITTNKPKTPLETEIDRRIAFLADLGADDPEYTACLDQIERLNKLKPTKAEPISRETMLVVAGNLAGILLILNHERLHPIPSKAMSFVMKSKL